MDEVKKPDIVSEPLPDDFAGMTDGQLAALKKSLVERNDHLRLSISTNMLTEADTPTSKKRDDAPAGERQPSILSGPLPDDFAGLSEEQITALKQGVTESAAQFRLRI